VPPFDVGAPRAQAPSAGAIPTPLMAAAVALPAKPLPEPARSSPLPQLPQGGKPPIGMLVGVALAFLVVGAVLAAIVLKLFGR